MRLQSLALCASLFGVVGGCTHTVPLKSETATFDWSSQQKRLLVIEPEVQLGELTVGGLVEPRADWSERAAHAIESGLSSALAQRGIEVKTLETLSDPHDVQLAK